jgi:thiol-disulfide isomerase/thioredoxin
MNKGLVSGLVGVVIVGGFIYLNSTTSTNEAIMAKESMEKAEMEKAQMVEAEAMKKAAMMKNEGEAMMIDEEAVMKKDDETMMDKDTTDKSMMKTEETSMMKKDEGAMMSAGSYVPYDATKIAMASADQDVVLFFRASWCPSCKVVDADITANLKAIPSSLTILEVDYDNSADLKRKYGVTTQHTFVQVDAQGALIKKWSGGATLASVVSEVQ